MSSEEKDMLGTIVKFRRALRDILGRAGFGTNPGWSDDQILDKISELVTGQGCQWIACVKCKQEFTSFGVLVYHLLEGCDVEAADAILAPYTAQLKERLHKKAVGQ